MLIRGHDEQRVLRELPKIPTPLVISDIPKAIKEKSVKLLDKFVDHAFEFVIEPYLPSQVLYICNTMYVYLLIYVCCIGLAITIITNVLQ